jgi:hypothetical protein
MRNQNALGGEEEERDQRQAAVAKCSRGGIAMTINSLPQDEHSRSGSQPRYPYMDRQPFQEQDRGHYGQVYQQLNQPQHTRNDSGGAYKRPQQYEEVQSTIKNKVDQDRRMF